MCRCAAGIPSAPGIRAEVRVERPVLLHDHHDVLDDMDVRTTAPALVVVGVTARLGAGPVVVDAVDPE